MHLKIRKKTQEVAPKPNKIDGSGFTLLEMVIAVGLFAIALVVISESFLVITRIQQKSKAVLSAQAEARYALEIISRKIRTGFIFYDHYQGGLTNPENEFAVVDLSDNGTVFALETQAANCPSAESSPCLKMLQDIRGTSTTTQYLTGKGLKIQNLNFYINPPNDPFINFPLTASQPRVTIVMSIQSLGTKPENIATAFLQTTVSSRYYKR